MAKCKCNKADETEEPHDCPYQCEVNSDLGDYKCNCCDDCQQECRDNI